MPNAQASTDSEHYTLETCPEGFVDIRRLPYGRWLYRQQIATEMTLAMAQGQKETKGEMKVMQRAVAEFEFKECIVNHNLENAAGEPLDFTKAFTLDLLDPKIGNEISAQITKLHQFGDDLGN